MPFSSLCISAWCATNCNGAGIIWQYFMCCTLLVSNIYLLYWIFIYYTEYLSCQGNKKWQKMDFDMECFSDTVECRLFCWISKHCLCYVQWHYSCDKRIQHVLKLLQKIYSTVWKSSNQKTQKFSNGITHYSIIFFIKISMWLLPK